MEKRKVHQKAAYRNRLAVFMDLYEKDWMTNVSLDVDNNDQLTRLLDAAIIKLEGGTDFDLKSLDEMPEETDKSSKDVSLFAVEDRSTSKGSLKETEDNTKVINDGEVVQKGDEEGEIDSEAGEVHSQSGDKPSNEITHAVDNEAMEEGETAPSLGEGVSSGNSNATENRTEDQNKPRPLHKTCSIFFRNLIASISRQEVEEVSGFKLEICFQILTVLFFLSKECKKFAGFIRLALSEPQVERRFARRGWATYERNVKIRDICWSLSSIRVS